MPASTTVPDLADRFARLIAAGTLELPMLPGVAAEVLGLVQLENTDAAKLSAVVHRDQTLASNVLRVANSPSYCGQTPCASLQQAVSRLGMQMITDIAMAVSVKGRVFQNPKCAELLSGLWRHSVLTGFFTKEIARTRRRNVEIAFLAGLLHDIGKAVLLANADRCTDFAQLPLDELSAALHLQHAAAGALLAKEWRMPESLQEAIVFHHEHERASKFAELAMTVCLADLLTHVVEPGALVPSTTCDALRQHPVLLALNLYPNQLDELLQKSDKALRLAESFA